MSGPIQFIFRRKRFSYRWGLRQAALATAGISTLGCVPDARVELPNASAVNTASYQAAAADAADTSAADTAPGDSPPVSPTPAAEIIAIGDSTTRGPADADWTGALPGLLGLADSQVANEGQPGEQSGGGILRLEAMIADGSYADTRVLIFWEGADDLLSFISQYDPLLSLTAEDQKSPLRREFEAQLTRTANNLAAAVADGHAAGWEVYLATYYPLPLDRSCSFSGPLGGLTLEELSAASQESVRDYLAELNARIRVVAGRTGARLIDLAGSAQSLPDDSENYFDCLHLSAAGNAQVAQWIAAALQNE